MYISMRRFVIGRNVFSRAGSRAVPRRPSVRGAACGAGAARGRRGRRVASRRAGRGPPVRGHARGRGPGPPPGPSGGDRLVLANTLREHPETGPYRPWRLTVRYKRGVRSNVARGERRTASRCRPTAVRPRVPVIDPDEVVLTDVMVGRRGGPP
jgi:hypothetical protein